MILFILAIVIVGGIVGGLARLLLPGPDPMSVPATIGIGIAGMLIAGIIFRVLFGTGAGWIAGILVTMGLVALVRRSRARRGYGPGPTARRW